MITKNGKVTKICFDDPNTNKINILSDINFITSKVDENNTNVDDNTTNIDENTTNIDENNTNVYDNTSNIDENDILSNNFSDKYMANEIITEEFKSQSINIKPVIEEIKKSDKNEETYICSNEDVLKNKCTTIIVTEIQINELNDIIKKEYLTNEYNGENNIIKTENVLFQVTTLDNQIEPNYKEVSIVDLGECQQKLKIYYHIPKEESLIIYKTDIKTSNFIQIFTQYEIYNPLNLEKLNLSVCENTTIIISSKVNLDNSTIALYNSLLESGYNLFNEGDSFYKDICSIYTSINGTDITLSDRKKEIFETNGNISLCQKGCEIKDFNSTTQEVKCKCSPQISEIETLLTYSDDKFIIEMFKNSMFSTIKNSHFLVLKCYKLAFEFNNLFKNIGRIILTIIIILSFIFLFVYFFRDFKKIDTLLISILNNRKYSNTEIINNRSNNKIDKNGKKYKRKKIKNKANIYKNNISMNNIVENKENKKERKNFEPPKKTKHSSEKNIRIINSENDTSCKDISKICLNKKRESTEPKKNIINNKTNINIIKIKNLQIKKYNRKKKKHIKKQSNNNIFYHNGYNENKILKGINKLKDQELNELKYEEAIELDKRTFCQFYFSLLKKNQLILFTFFAFDDYNLFSIKVCLFLTNFSLFLSINCFFFNDNIMHKIFKDNGAYRIIYQLPNIIYTSLISLVINLILKQLALSETKILQIKKLKKISLRICKTIKRCLKIRFTFFFIINYLLLLFFWYYISCFSAVFINTQTTLFIDASFSFGLSLLYPFGYNLIPGFFRILSLRTTKRDKLCLYEMGRITSLN